MPVVPPETRFESFPNFLWDERQADSIPDRFSPEDHSPRAVVDRVAAAGGICVKTHWEDGFGPQKIWPTPTAEMIRAVIAASHDRGLTVAMHANSYEAHRFAADVGVDIVVHGLSYWDGLGSEASDAAGVPAEIAAVLDSEIEQGIGIMPTTRVVGGLRDLFDPAFLPAFLDEPLLLDAVPRSLVDWYRTEEGTAFSDEIRLMIQGMGMSDEAIYDQIGAAGRVVGYLAENDAPLLFGTDTPAPSYANPPGLNGWLEMRLLTEHGVTPRQIFEAATLANARAFHLEADLGSIQPGKVGNLLLLRQNPLETVDAWSTIETVVVRGTAVERASLSARRRP